ncbi:CDP-alcohol phosphatidyltransferase family protein [Candidatus Uabimicrobium sp. HlEnr_7]|uniref:CDP-alcohol phosphatidyltransferase family protein n=1 Tax=Candidatus Uabimicrobium helgolandensis TaxID=3095367 RepID=UPI003558E9C0
MSKNKNPDFANKSNYIIAIFFLTTSITAWIIKYKYLPEYKWYLVVICTILVGVFFKIFLKYNTKNQIPYTKIGFANYITLFRGGCIAIITGNLWCELNNFIAILYIFAVILDVVDGFVARKTNHISIFGEKMDMECDALGMFVVTLICVQQGQLPLFYIFVGLLRYFFVFHLKWRNKQSISLPISNLRRFLAGLHMIFIAMALFPNVPNTILFPVSYVFVIPFYVIFIRDWLWVIGKFHKNLQVYKFVSSISSTCFFKLIPLITSGTLLISFTSNTLQISISAFIFLCCFINLFQISVRFISFIVIITYCIVIVFMSPSLYTVIAFSSIVVSIGSNIRPL